MSKSPLPGLDRRTIPQRDTRWAARIADALAAARLTPNSISALSVVFALGSAAALVASAYAGPRPLWLVLAAVGMPLRLLCNMLDGMLAVEHGLKTPTGDLFNEVPDRLADLVVIAAAGYATGGLWRWGSVDLGVALGWVAASAAVLTAYVRTLGAANGVGNFFDGPASKPNRMWLLVAGCLVSLLEGPLGLPRGSVLLVSVGAVALGSIVTVVIRLRRIAAALHARGPAAGTPAEGAR